MIFVPFLVIDIVVASVLMSLGMMMLSPVLVALPFKLMLFVLADGWNLLMGSLANSFARGDAMTPEFVLTRGQEALTLLLMVSLPLLLVVLVVGLVVSIVQAITQIHEGHAVLRPEAGGGAADAGAGRPVDHHDTGRLHPSHDRVHPHAGPVITFSEAQLVAWLSPVLWPFLRVAGLVQRRADLLPARHPGARAPSAWHF